MEVGPYDGSMQRRSTILLTLIVAAALSAASCSELTLDVPADSTGPAGAGLDAPVDTGDEIAPTLDPTPLGVDPDVTIGMLANGLTYYVRSNDSPGGALELSLVVNAGSAQQMVPGDGSAHFLEHMLFNGTERFPANELDDVLRGFGMQIGPDINAYTSYDETVYLLSLPAVDDETVGLGLDVLRQWAGNATIEPEQVIAERGVVREELRFSTESKDAALALRFDELYTSASGYEGYAPIGTEDAILATTDATLRAFYDDWYRPDLMAVVAVGDVPADELVAAIEERFSDLASRGRSPAPREINARPVDTPVVGVLALPDGPEPAISLDYGLPRWDRSTVGGERLLLADDVIAAMVDDRLNELADRGEIDIVRPFAATFDYGRQRRFLGINTTATDLSAGTTQTLLAIRSLKEDGFTEADLDRARRTIRSALDQELAAGSRRPDQMFAAAYTSHFLSGAGIDSLERRHRRLVEALDEFTAAGLSGHFRWSMNRSAPLLLVYGDDDSGLPTEAELEAAVETAADADTLERAGDTDIDRLGQTPDPVDPIDTGPVDGLADGRVWQFANGATVVYAPSSIAPAEVDLLTRSSGGSSLLTPADAVLAQVATTAVDASSVADIDPVAFDRFLSDRVVSFQSYIDPTGEGFAGRAGTDDLDIMFQLLHLRATAARVDQSGLGEALDVARNALREAETNPQFASVVAWQRARFGEDPRYRILPEAAALDAVTADDLLRIHRSRFGGVDDLVVAVVGDIGADEVLDLARHFIGTLPAQADDRYVDTSADPPPGPIELEIDAGVGDAGAGVDLYYSVRRPWSDAEAAAGAVLASIIDKRLFDRVREAMGASYSGGQSQFQFLDEPVDDIQLVVSVSGDPDRVDELRGALDAELTDLVADGPTADELDAAVQVALADAQFTSNFDILSGLVDALDGPAAGSYQGRETLYRQLELVTAEAVGDLAGDILVADALIAVTRASAG